MPAQKTLTGPGIPSEASQPAGRGFAWALLGALIAAALFSAKLPMALVLPALSIFLLAAGFSIATILYLAGSRMSTSSSPAWELAGALVFLGFAAAILTEPRETLAVLDHMETSGRAAMAK